MYPKSDADRFHIPRKDGGAGLITIEDCAELAVRGLEAYVHGSKERIMQAARGDKLDGLEAASVLKIFHGQYLTQTKEVMSEQS